MMPENTDNKMMASADDYGTGVLSMCENISEVSEDVNLKSITMDKCFCPFKK